MKKLKTLKDCEHWGKVPEEMKKLQFSSNKEEIEEFKERLTNAIERKAISDTLVFGRLMTPVDSNELREEAKKHLEKLEEDRKEVVKLCGHFDEEAGVIGTRDWIKRFFNLEEEIKCGNGSKIKCPVAKEKIVGFGGLE